MVERVRRHPAEIAEGTKVILRSIGEHGTGTEERSCRQPIITLSSNSPNLNEMIFSLFD